MGGPSSAELRLRMHHELVRELLPGALLENIAPRLLGVIARGMHWDVGTLWRVDEAGAQLRPHATWRNAEGDAAALEEHTRALTFARGVGEPGRVWASAAPLRRDDLLTDPSFVRGLSASKAGLRAGIWFPIVAAGSVWGVLEFFGMQPIAGDHQLDEVVALLGSQLGQHVEHAGGHRALPRGASKLSRLYESDIIGVLVAASDGRLLEANDAFLDLLGYTRDELDAGLLAWPDLTPPRWTAIDAAAVARLRASGVVPPYEKEYLTKDGSLVPVIIGAAMLDGSDQAICFVFDNREQKRTEGHLGRLTEELEQRVQERTVSLHASEGRSEAASAALAVSKDELHALAAQLLSVREEERARLAREIHDALGQDLTGLKMDVTWVARRVADLVPRAEPVLARLEEMTGHLDALIQTARRIATDLRPRVLDDLGLLAALEWQAAEFQRRHGVVVQVTPPRNGVPQLTPQQSIAVFRVVQELLTNVARHAGATNVHLHLTSTVSELSIVFTDDGGGIDEAHARASRSLGLLGMRERLRSVRAELNFDGKAGRGTTARIRLPLGHG